MAQDRHGSTRVRGGELRHLRKRAFKSAEAFAAACGSVSVPTVYRAERGGPILISYLERMAAELGVEVDSLVSPDLEPHAKRDLTGEWLGLIVASDRLGRPYVVREDVRLVQDGSDISGSSAGRSAEYIGRDVLVSASFKDNVLSGLARSEEWPFPFECAAFIVAGTGELNWLDGFTTWFDVEINQPQMSRYFLIRKGTSDFDTLLLRADRIVANEGRQSRLRRLLDAGHEFADALPLVAQSEMLMVTPKSSPPKQNAWPGKTGGAQPILAMDRLIVLDEETTHRFLADGLVDDIATALVHSGAVGVIPTRALPSPGNTSLHIVSAQGATHFLGGSMQKKGDHIRVNIQLVEVESGRIIWAKRYEHKGSTEFSIYDDIADDVVSAFSQTSGKMMSGPVDAIDPRAYELFVKGRSLYLRGMYVHSLRAAEALLCRAIAIEPKFARAYAQLSICQSYLTLSTSQIADSSPAPDGYEDALRALELDPDLTLAHAALGLSYYATGQYDLAGAALAIANEKDPSLFEAEFFLARNCRLQGDRIGAARHFGTAARLRSDDFRSNGLLAEELLALGRHDEATHAFNKTLALVEAELESHPDNAGALAFGAAVLAHLRRVKPAVDWAEWAIAIAPNDCLVRYNVARVHVLQGDIQTSLGILESTFKATKNVQRRLALWLSHDRDFDLLSKMDRFEALLSHSQSA